MAASPVPFGFYQACHHAQGKPDGGQERLQLASNGTLLRVQGLDMHLQSSPTLDGWFGT